MLSLRPEGKHTVVLRLHRMFLSACNDVLDEIASYVNDTRQQTPLVRNFINSNLHRLREKPLRQMMARTEGKHYDLHDIYHRISENIPGNPWIITTLWLADYYIAKAKNINELKNAKEIFKWVAKCALSSGILGVIEPAR